MAFVTGAIPEVVDSAGVVLPDVSESFRNLPMEMGRCPMCLLDIVTRRRFTKLEVLVLECVMFEFSCISRC